MKTNIHPKYKKINFTCSCGNVIEVFSIICKNKKLDICNNCHPFYTGEQREDISGGRISIFNKRFKT
ncbi:MAG: 50S ribosomal protein L31 [Enterobacteriaceae bacterium PSpyr]|nr:MAG: 50S ribosomal protein L31 [Enterobacteriaceae bacterium PSpyr]